MVPGQKELNTWAEIADYLGVSVRTAQNWEKELGLPVKRITEGPRGRTLALVVDLDRWKQQRLQEPTAPNDPADSDGHGAESPPTPPNSKAPTGKRWLALSAVVCVGGILATAAIMHYRDSRPIAMLSVDGPFLIAKDTSGAELWRHFFERGLYGDLFIGNPVSKYYWIGSLEDPGKSDVLFNYYPPGPIQESSFMMCFSRTGRVKWEFRVGKTVRDSGGEIHPPYHISAFSVVGAPGTPKQSRIVVGSGHGTAQAFQVAILDSAGRATAEYWHPGALYLIYSIKAAGSGGTPRVLAAGVNNGEHRATLVVLDPFAMSGISTPSRMKDQHFRLLDMPEAKEDLVILFPRTCLSRDEPYTRVGTVTVDDHAIHVITVESFNGLLHRNVFYDFDFSLRLTSAVLSSDYRDEHLKLERAGVLHHSWREDEAGLAKGFEYRPQAP